MPSVVSHAWIPIKKDAPGDVLKDFNQGGKALATPGLVQTYRGTAVDPNEPAHVELIAVWESMDAVLAAHSNPDHKAAFEALGAFEDKSNPAIKTQHNIFTFNNDFVDVAAAPVVMFNALLVDPAKQAELDAVWAEVIKGEQPTGLIAGAHGWGAHEIDAPDFGKGKMFLAVSGWESKAAAEAVRAGAAEKETSLSKFGKQHVRLATLTNVK